MLIGKIKKELERLGMKPNKTLGQNFLVNEGIYKKILDVAQIKPGETILEVGAGLGTLTEYLAATGANIVAVEKDAHLVGYLKIKLKNLKNVRIVEDDILKFDPQRYALGIVNYKIVGNIPYYLTSHLIRTIFENWPQPKEIILMVQKEVAQRMSAKPPQMSLLGVATQFYSKVEIAGRVSRGSFYPMPKVDSAIIKLIPSPEPYTLNPESFFKVVSAGFSGKRKQLINTLSGGLKLPREKVELKLLSLGISPQRRAETLTIEEWQKLTDIIYGGDIY